MTGQPPQEDDDRQHQSEYAGRCRHSRHQPASTPGSPLSIFP